MPETLQAPLRRITPSPGAGLLITLFQRYVDRAPGRTRRELALAEAIDAYPGGRAALEGAVTHWRALPLDKRVAAVGRSYATLNPAIALDDNELTSRVRTTFTGDNLVQVAPHLSMPRRTAAALPLGARPFVLPEEAVPVQRGIKLGDNLKLANLPDQGALQAGDVVSSAVRKPGPLIGQAPLMQFAKGPAGPLYQLEFAGIYCQKESSWDGGSTHDEIYSCFSMMGDKGANWTLRSAVYDLMDSGDDWREDPAPCLLYGPGPAPAENFYLNALMCENDWGNPDTITKMWHDAATVASCIAKYYGVEVSQTVSDAAADLLDKIFGLGDDIMSSATVVLGPGAFAYYAAQPLLHFKVQLNYHFFTFHTDNDAKYYSFYRVRKL